MLPRLQAKALIADRSYDADSRVLDRLAPRNITAVIPPKPARLVKRTIDWHLYARRHLTENFFARLKLWRAIASRYNKTARNFLGSIHLAAATILLN
jgi:transposase